MSDDRPTCGKGLAWNASLPRAMGNLIGATADVLEQHMKALDLSDPASRQEHDAYASLLMRHRRVAAELDGVAAEMMSYRDMPMGRHDMTKMIAPENREVFVRFIGAEAELQGKLQEHQQQDRALLGQM